MASKRLFQWLHNFTARIASMILALGFLDGVVGAWLYGNTPFPNSAIVFMIANAFLAFLWFRLDSDQRSYRRTPFLTSLWLVFRSLQFRIISSALAAFAVVPLEC
jgi:hypothetical protein